MKQNNESSHNEGRVDMRGGEKRKKNLQVGPRRIAMEPKLFPKRKVTKHQKECIPWLDKWKKE